MLKVAVFVSGRGSNLRAILNSSKLLKLIKVQAVISNKLNCPAFKIAEEYSISNYVVGKEDNSIFLCQAADLLKLIAWHQVAGGIVGAINDNRPGVGLDVSPQFL